MDENDRKLATRFYGNLKFASDVLENKRVTFIHVSLLNDPFDPYCFFETDFGDSYLNFLKYMKSHHSRELPLFRGHVTPQSWNRTTRDLTNALRRIREIAFVLSMTRERGGRHPKDNLYMWGHYANGHRGVAIEFDMDALRRSVFAQHAAVNQAPSSETEVWAEMHYRSKFSPLSAEQIYQFLKQEIDAERGRIAVKVTTDLERHYSHVTTMKSDVWQNENEWRLMWRNDETDEKIYQCPISGDSIVNIFFGMCIQPDERQQFVHSAKASFPKASLYAAKKRYGDLALDFAPIS